MPPIHTVARLVAVAVSILPAVAAAAPAPVAPGSPERLSPVTSGCPTFSWTVEAAATGYEIVVYPVSEGAGVASETPSLHQRLPAGAASWTPAADRCLAPGSYGWSVRADESAGSGTWSEASLFEVPGARSPDAPSGPLGALAAALGAGVSEDDVARALRALALRPGGEGELEPAARPAVPPSWGPEGEAASPSLEARKTTVGGGPRDLQPRAAGTPLLHVGGDVLAGGSFGFSQPRNTVMELGPLEFVVSQGLEDDVWTVSSSGFGFIQSIPDSTANVFLAAPVTDPPDGATVTVFSCSYMDQSASQDLEMTFRLRRRLVGSADAEVMAQVSETSSGSSFDIGGPVTTSITGATIDTDFFTYWVEGTWKADVVGSSLAFYGCTVIFSVPSLEP